MHVAVLTAKFLGRVFPFTPIMNATIMIANTAKLRCPPEAIELSRNTTVLELDRPHQTTKCEYN
jgi:hypothetical protein